MTMYVLNERKYVYGISYVFLDSKTQAQSQGITFFVGVGHLGNVLSLVILIILFYSNLGSNYVLYNVLY